MPINLDPTIVRTSEKTTRSQKSVYSELDCMKPAQHATQSAKKLEKSDPAQKAFATDSAYRSRIAR